MPPRGKTCEIVAEIAGSSPRTAQDVMTVFEGDAALFEQVKAGKIAGHQAARRVRRLQRDRDLAPAPLRPSGPFEVVLADPAWQMGSPDSPSAPEQHYPTMALEEIQALKVPAAEDAVLFLWAVNCLLPEALQVIEAWGFAYKAQLVWVKDRPGTGNWVRNQHELLLIGRKGSFPTPDPEDRVASVITAKRGRHSQKPISVYEAIERMYPLASKVELFARGKERPGWIFWGNEFEPADAGSGSEISSVDGGRGEQSAVASSPPLKSRTSSRLRSRGCGRRRATVVSPTFASAATAATAWPTSSTGWKNRKPADDWLSSAARACIEACGERLGPRGHHAARGYPENPLEGHPSSRDSQCSGLDPDRRIVGLSASRRELRTWNSRIDRVL